MKIKGYNIKIEGGWPSKKTKKEGKMEKREVRVIYTHWNPDFDAGYSTWLLKKFGEEKWPGVGKARVEFLKSDRLPGGKTAMELEMEGKLCVDIGRGRYDHHQLEENTKECAATLIACDLGIDNDPALEKLLKLVVRDDLQGKSQPSELPKLVKTMNAYYPENPEKVLAWLAEILEAIYSEQLEFWWQKYFANARIDEVELPGNRVLEVFSGQSNSRQFQTSCRRKGAAVVIQQRSSGHVQIFTDRRDKLIIDDIVQMVRLEEMKAKGKVEITDWKILRSPGKMPEVRQWYYQVEAQNLFNGSLTAPEDIPVTKLSLDKIREIVLLGINDNYFPHPGCRENGVCVRQQCPFYWYGLHRCRKLRFEEHKKTG